MRLLQQNSARQSLIAEQDAQGWLVKVKSIVGNTQTLPLQLSNGKSLLGLRHLVVDAEQELRKELNAHVQLVPMVCAGNMEDNETAKCSARLITGRKGIGEYALKNG